MGRRHLAVAALEARGTAVTLDQETPVSALPDLHALDREHPPASPPLLDEVGLGPRAPHLVTRGVEGPLDPHLSVGRGGDGHWVCCDGHGGFPSAQGLKASKSQSHKVTESHGLRLTAYGFSGTYRD